MGGEVQAKAVLTATLFTFVRVSYDTMRNHFYTRMFYKWSELGERGEGGGTSIRPVFLRRQLGASFVCHEVFREHDL